MTNNAIKIANTQRSLRTYHASVELAIEDGERFIYLHVPIENGQCEKEETKDNRALVEHALSATSLHERCVRSAESSGEPS